MGVSRSRACASGRSCGFGTHVGFTGHILLPKSCLMICYPRFPEAACSRAQRAVESSPISAPPDLQNAARCLVAAGTERQVSQSSGLAYKATIHIGVVFGRANARGGSGWCRVIVHAPDGTQIVERPTRRWSQQLLRSSLCDFRVLQSSKWVRTTRFDVSGDALQAAEASRSSASSANKSL